MASVGFLDHTRTVVYVLSYELLLMGLSVEISVLHPMQELFDQNLLFCPFKEPK
jgi:hypothetical protein